MMSALNVAGMLLGLIGAAALGLFILTMVVGVPAFLVYVARLGPDASSDVRRLNHRLFVFSSRVFYTAFFCILLSKLLGAISGG